MARNGKDKVDGSTSSKSLASKATRTRTGLSPGRISEATKTLPFYKCILVFHDKHFCQIISDLKLLRTK